MLRKIVITDAGRVVTDGEKRLDESERTDKEITGIECTDTELIAESQSMLKNVRERKTAE